MDSFGLERLAESLNGTETVRLDTAFGAAHRACCFCDIHFFPVTHQECFPLTRRQMLDFKLDIPERLSTACQVFGALGLLATLGAAPGFQQVEITAAVAIALKVTHV